MTRMLDTRAVYILPRMTPDGVDGAVASSPGSGASVSLGAVQGGCGPLAIPAPVS